LNLQTLRLYTLQDTNISLATDVCVTSQNNQKFISKYTSFNCALRGPFDALRCARLSVIPTPCNCTLHRYLHFIGLKLLFDKIEKNVTNKKKSMIILTKHYKMDA